NKISILPLIPRAQFCSPQIHSVGQHGQRLRRQLQLGHLRLQVLRPRKSPFPQPLGQNPQPSAVPAQDFDSRMPPVAKDEERPTFGIFAETLGDGRMESVEAFAHVARLYGNEYPETAGKAQHDFSSATSKAAASEICLASIISNRALPGNCTCNGTATGAGCAATASSKRSGDFRTGRLVRR